MLSFAICGVTTLLYPAASLCFLCQFFQFFNDDGSIGHPQRKSRTHIIIHGKNAQLLSQVCDDLFSLLLPASAGIHPILFVMEK